MENKTYQDCMFYNCYHELCEYLAEYILPDDERAKTCKEFE